MTNFNTAALRELLAKAAGMTVVDVWPLDAGDFEPDAHNWKPGHREYFAAAVNALPTLLDAADRLARIEAVIGSADPEAIALAILNSDRAMAGLPPTDNRANCPDSDGYVTNATAALAALRELIGGV